MKKLKCLTTDEVASLLGFKPSTILRWERQGKFPRAFSAQPGVSKRWLETDLDAWLEKRRRTRAKQTPRGFLRKYHKCEPGPDPAATEAATAALERMSARILGEE
jgi:excisionase family DNA binding protein